ncbi:restriction endonuclease subunit S [Selenomonas sputigena]|uniref:restriction endonuclease subunit S n=1 Tax=Selenomonas sputigena TaxID=69823 RepID=UPI0022316644|nr:restriction endonuclease subunit S [Selenomonas sputigena]UZD42242.1 restriction endonuclease subunit S [Selenomonas sputigena]
MAEWVMKKLKDIADFNPRESLPKGTAAKKVAMDKLQPFCRDIPGYELEPFSGGTKFRNGDTIMARITPCLENGKTAKVSILDDGEVGFGSTEYIVFRAKEGVDEDFIYYLVCSPIVREPAIKSMVGSSGRQRVQTDVVQNLDILVPGYEEQKRISELLKSLDDKIAANTEVNKNLQEQAQALFRERFLSNSGMSENWKLMTLGEVSDMSAGGDKPKIISDHKSNEYKYPVFSNGISDEGLYGFTSDYKISAESVTVSARGTIGFVCLRHVPFTPIVRLVTLVPHTEILSAKYLYLWLLNTPIHGTGTTQQQLTVPDFRKTEIIIPTEVEMKTFTETVDPLFQKIWSNQEESTKLAELRDTLLPRLMSGELDVSHIDL